MRPVTAQMLEGELGSSPTVDASFELYVDSTKVDNVPMSVVLVCSAPVTAFDYDAKILTVKTETDGDFKGRRFTFVQKDATKKPTWADVSFSMDGTGAAWVDDTGKENLFTLRSVGFGNSFPLGYADLTNNVNTILARGGIHAATHKARHKFDMNGAVILKIVNVGPDAAYPNAIVGGWSAIRLMLKDAAALTYSDITARAFVDSSITSTPLPVKQTLLLRDDRYTNNDWLGITVGVEELDPGRIRITVDARGQGLVGDLVGGSFPDAQVPLQQTGGTARYLMLYQFSDGSNTSEPGIDPVPITISAGQVHQLNITPATFNKPPGITLSAFTLIDNAYGGYLTGAHYYTLVVGNGADRSGRPAVVRLGPVVEGLRTLDLSWPNDAAFPHFQGTREILVVINAPILKYLLVWEKTTQIPVVENDNGGRDSTIEVYYNPAASYSSGYRPPSALSDWPTMSSQRLAIDLELFIALESLAQGPSYPLGGWRPDIAFGNPASVSLGPARSSQMDDPDFAHTWPGLLNYEGTAPQVNWFVDVRGNKENLFVTMAVHLYVYQPQDHIEVIVQVETTSGTWTSFGIAGEIPSPGQTGVGLYRSPEALCQAHDGSHWTGRVRFSDLRNDSPDLIWDGGPPGDATLPVAAAYIPHAVRNIDITVTPTPVTTVEAGGERGHFS